MLTFMYSDSAVVRKVLQGNQGLFRVLVNRYAGVVHSIAYAYLRNSADAEDIAQETFTRFYEQLDRLAHHTQVGPWLVNVARNVSVDLIRKRGRESDFARRSAGPRAAIPDPMREELHRLLWEQLDSLDGEAREVLILHYFMHKKAREIGGLLGITPDAAAKRVQRARDELGRRLTDLLGDELGEIKTDSRREARIMAAVCATPVAWKASAAGATAAATAAGVATGAGAGKIAAALAAVAIIVFGGYLGYHRFSQPYSTQNVTAKTSVTEATAAAPKPDNADAAALPPSNSTPAPADSDESRPAPEDTAAVEDFPIATGTVRGTVTTEDGVPAAGATVRIDNTADLKFYENLVNAGYSVNPIQPMEYTSTTDSAGQYEIMGICIGTERQYFPSYSISSRKGSLYGQGYVYNLTHLEPEITCDIVLHADLSLGGKVIDLQGQPVAGALIMCFDEPRENRPNIGKGLTDESGGFLIEHLRAGTVFVSAIPRGYLPQEFVPVTAGTLDNVFRVNPVNVISGRVVNQDTGEPVPKAIVMGEKDAANWQERYIQGRTDEAGKFAMGACYPGTYMLNVHCAQDSPRLGLVDPLSVTVAGGPISGLELRVSAGAKVYGTVIDDETGAPMPGQGSLSVFQGSNPPRVQARTMVKLDGTYELEGLIPGTFDIKVVTFLAFRGGTVRDGGAITLAPGETMKQHDIHLAPRPLFTGRVVDERGDAVAGASVYAANEAGTLLMGDAVSDTSGNFKLAVRQENVTDILYVQAKSGNGYSEPAGPYNSRDGHTDILLRLETSGRLEGELVDRQGQPVDEAIIAAIPETTGSLFLYPSRDRRSDGANDVSAIRTRAEADGTFVYDSLRPGAYTLEVYLFSSPAGLPLARSTVTIQGGRTTRARLEVNVEGFGSIVGRVTAGGKPAPDTYVYIDPGSEEWSAQHIELTDSEGQYLAQHVLPGPVKITVHLMMNSGVRTGKTQTAEVVSGEVATVDFNFAAGDASVEGYVLYNGAPPGRGQVYFEPADSPGAGGPRVDIDETGWYKAENLAPGLYNAQAKLGEGGWALISPALSVQVELLAGQTVRADIEIVGGEIAGTVAGLKADQRAIVALFPGNTQLSAWTVAAFELIGSQMLADTSVWQDGPFLFKGVPQGDYVVGAAALPVGVAPNPIALIKAPIVTEVVHVEPGAVSEVALVFQEE
ncbi:MAG TPA: sigma-70 family RNA polymerase sigma factor [Candidatus Bathyarchaeia archaeon]|nr:sigma-70 family RNA polymerase sigma factor [Candidatus Bathyarchaeia archaeon]